MTHTGQAKLNQPVKNLGPSLVRFFLFEKRVESGLSLAHMTWLHDGPQTINEKKESESEPESLMRRWN